MSRPVVAVVGRANVGKSTLVNRLAGRRLAIEHPEPGVTRDRQPYDVVWRGTALSVVDTGGWEPRARGLIAKVVAQAERAAREADLVLFVVDVKTGATADDVEVARRLRRAAIPVIVVANKVDTAAGESDAAALERLGLGVPVPVSALHGRGSGDLLDMVVTSFAGRGEPSEKVHEVRVAIVGRPNVGKSSLLNRIAGDERAIVDEEPGTTRDAIDTIVEADGRRYRFVDTAGMRRRARQARGPEYYGVVRSLRAIDEADVAMLVLDASAEVSDQDRRIARRLADAGRAALVVVNKWDLLGSSDVGGIEEEVAGRLAFVAWAPVLRASAKTGRGMTRILPAVDRVHASWSQRVPTPALNKWLREVTTRVPLGGGGRRPTALRYATQAGIRPPQIVLFSSGDVSASALRALERRFRERFGFEGSPVRMVVRRRGRTEPRG